MFGRYKFTICDAPVYNGDQFASIPTYPMVMQ